MTSLFDDERIIEIYVEDRARDREREAARKTERAIAERVIRKGKMSLEDISDYFSSLSLDELKEIEADIMQPT